MSGKVSPDSPHIFLPCWKSKAALGPSPTKSPPRRLMNDIRHESWGVSKQTLYTLSIFRVLMDYSSFVSWVWCWSSDVWHCRTSYWNYNSDFIFMIPLPCAHGEATELEVCVVFAISDCPWSRISQWSENSQAASHGAKTSDRNDQGQSELLREFQTLSSEKI